MGTVLELRDGNVAGSLSGIGVFGLSRPASPGFRPLYGHTSGFEPDQTFHVVDQVGHTDLGSGSGDADGADEQSHGAFLHGEDMLDL